MSIQSPSCRLINPDSALRCDCDYNFDTGIVDSKQAKPGRSFALAFPLPSPPSRRNICNQHTEGGKEHPIHTLQPFSAKREA